jgi:hypothetical protein
MYSQSNFSAITGESIIICLVNLSELFKIVELLQVAISSKDNAVSVEFNLSNEVASSCLSKTSKNWVSVLSSLTGNKKNNSSVLSPICKKLSTNFGMNISTELRVLSEAKLHLNEDSINEYSGLMKLLNSRSEFFESLLQLTRKAKQIKAIKSFNLKLKIKIMR